MCGIGFDKNGITMDETIILLMNKNDRYVTSE